MANEFRFNGLSVTVRESSSATPEQAYQFTKNFANNVSAQDPDMGWFSFLFNSKTTVLSLVFSDELQAALNLEKDLYHLTGGETVINNITNNTDDSNSSDNSNAGDSGDNTGDDSITDDSITDDENKTGIGNLSDWVTSANVTTQSGWIEFNNGQTKVGTESIEKSIPAQSAGTLASFEWQQETVYYGSAMAEIEIIYEVIDSVTSEVINSQRIASNAPADYYWKPNSHSTQYRALAFSHTGNPLIVRITDSSTGGDPDRAGHFWRIR